MRKHGQRPVNQRPAPVNQRPAPVNQRPAPVQQSPARPAPASQGPVRQAPVSQGPVYQQPAYQQPAYQQPASQGPVHQGPVQQEPVYQAPPAQPARQRNPNKGGGVRVACNLRSLRVYAKGLELALAIVIYCMHYNCYEADNLLHQFIITTAFAGFLIVVLGTFLGLITGNEIPKTMDTFYCVCGAALYITAGSLTIQHFKGWTFNSSTSNLGLTKGSLAIVQGALFLIDAFFVYRG